MTYFKIYCMEALIIENCSIVQHILAQDVEFKKSIFKQLNSQEVF